MSFEGDRLPIHRIRQEETARSREDQKTKTEIPEWYRQLEAAGKVQPRISRRAFLAGAGALAAAATMDNVTKYSRLAKWLDDQFVGQYNYDEAVKDAKAFLKERYKIDLFVGDGKQEEDVKADPTTLEKYRASLRIIVEEFSKYPPEMIQVLGEGRGFHVRIVEGLMIRTAPGSNIGRRVGGAAPWLREKRPAQILLQATETPVQQARLVHHELNHRAANHWENSEERDKKWISFHATVTDAPYRPVRPEVDGNEAASESYFLTEYAAQSPIEDEATCAEFMMVPSLHQQFIEQWNNTSDSASKDILTKKYVETMRNYHTWSNGKIDEAFWHKIIEEGRRQQGGS